MKRIERKIVRERFRLETDLIESEHRIDREEDLLHRNTNIINTEASTYKRF